MARMGLCVDGRSVTTAVRGSQGGRLRRAGGFMTTSARKNRTKRIVMSELRGESPFGGERPLGRPQIWLAVILVVYLILAIWYNAVIPAATASQHQPDENGHM